MDEQLIRLFQDTPSLPQLIYDAINSGLSNAALPFLPEVGRGIRESRKTGYIQWLFVEAQIKSAIEALIIPTLKANWVMNNGNSHDHLELVTPYGILMFAKVSKPEAVPRSAFYRQKYTDQCFISEALPDYKVFSNESIPVYVITFSCHPNDGSTAEIFIGRLSQDQRSWSKIWSIKEILAIVKPDKIHIEALPVVVKEEIIAAQKRIVKKSV